MMGNVKFPSLTFSWEEKQPLEKVISAYIAAAETCG